MQVGLKIWRYDSKTGDRALREYEVDAPEEATLLDCLDLVKDKHDGSLAYRKSCRMMICGSCGMRMDGGAVLACKTAMKPFVDVLPTAVFYPGDQASWPAVQGQIQQTIGTGVQGADPQAVLDAIQAAAAQ